MISARDDRHRISLFLGRSVGSDLMEANVLRRIGTSRLTTDATRVVPNVDLELWCTAGVEPSSVNFQSSEFRLAHDAVIVQIPILDTCIDTQIIWESKKIRVLIRYQRNISLGEQRALHRTTC